MLTEKQVTFIVNSNLTNRQIASLESISVRRVRQLRNQYRKTGIIPVLGKPGRPKSSPLASDERDSIIKMYKIYRVGACYLERKLKERGIRAGHNRIHRVLLEEGFAMNEPRKQRGRKWVRYEREHSNSLWHVDWHEIKDLRWKGMWLIAYEDDSSRFVVGYGVYPTLTSAYSVDVLRRSIAAYGKPEQIISDHGSTFYAVESVRREKGLTEFEKFLIKEKITFIVGRVDHPQTNGKIEKFFDTFEKKVKYFNSVDDFMSYYNYIKPHGAFENYETPAVMYEGRKIKKEALMDPALLDRGEEMIWG
ncbi:MAG: transposase [Nitrososphaerota archaeon]|nr:transposase [Nitrososphaerota archaeon]